MFMVPPKSGPYSYEIAIKSDVIMGLDRSAQVHRCTPCIPCTRCTPCTACTLCTPDVRTLRPCTRHMRHTRGAPSVPGARQRQRTCGRGVCLCLCLHLGVRMYVPLRRVCGVCGVQVRFTAVDRASLPQHTAHE